MQVAQDRAAVALLLFLALLSPAACRHDRPRPNVILVLVDALRADHLGCYGYPGKPTPNIDRLADTSLFFVNAYSNATWTVPSVASLFTATLPVVHRINRAPKKQLAFSVLPDEFVLVNEVLKVHGYTTAMITTIGWVSPRANYDQGVDVYTRSKRGDEDLVRLARQFVSEHKSKRFALYLHFIDLHDYYKPTRLFAPGWEEKLDRSSNLLKLRGLKPRESYSMLEEQLSRPGLLTRRDLDFLIDAYDRELQQTDRLIGELVEHLRRERLLNRTLIVLTSDHGEQFLEHQKLLHGSDAFYNEVLHIPVIIAAPGRFPDRSVVSTPISSTDIFPTLFDVLGIEKPMHFQGASALVEPQEDRTVFATNGETWKAITAEWSYIHSPSRDELYHLRLDRGERRNLADQPQHQAIRFELKERIRKTAEESRNHPYLKSGGPPTLADMSEEEREALKALGYLD